MLVNSWVGQAGHSYYSVCYDRLWLLWPREEDRPRAGFPSFSQREVSKDEFACEPSQVLAELRPCPWWMGYCRSEVVALRVPCLTKVCTFMKVHPTVITSDFAQWRVRTIWLPVGAPLPRSSTLPMSSRVSCCFTGHHRWSWSGFRCLRFPSEFFAPGIFASAFQRAAASRSSILAGMQPGHP